MDEKKKVYETFSITEKELFLEAKHIKKRDKKLEEERKLIEKEVTEREKYPPNYIPYNNIMSGNIEKYYDKKVAPCPELEDNEMNRLFNKYDRSNTGMFKKEDIQMLFFDIKDLLEKRKIEFNENKLINHMLDFYASAGPMITKSDIKKCYGKILHQYKANLLKDKVKISDLDYLKKLATGKEEEKVEKKPEGQRRDIFQIKCITDKAKREVILNENKLEKMYE